MEDYCMADPRIVRATWNPRAALLGREMLLELRLYRIFRVRAGVRVTRVWDEERVVAGRRARVFGYEYVTLRAHVEMGRMDYYQLYKCAMRAPSSSACMRTRAPPRMARPGSDSASGSSAAGSRCASSGAAASGSPA
jgi:hypothetical protein